MDSGGLISRASASLMPTQAILVHELRDLASSWLVRLWLVGTALVTFVAVAGNWQTVRTAPLIAGILFSYLVFPWFLVVIVLGIGPITGARLDALADGILSRPVTRYEYLFACWAARVLVVLAVFLAVAVPAIAILALAKRPVIIDGTTFPGNDGVTWYGVVASLSLVALVLTFLVTLSFFAGTVLRKPLLSAVVLVFVWFPVNLVLHTFALEEFSPISLSQAVPTLLRRPWPGKDPEMSDELSAAEVQALMRLGSQLTSWFSGGTPPPSATNDSFFDKGDYTDFSVWRVSLGYGVPTALALGLSALFFCWRDL